MWKQPYKTLKSQTFLTHYRVRGLPHSEMFWVFYFMTTIYYLQKESGEIFYIGQTSNPISRLGDHVKRFGEKISINEIEKVEDNYRLYWEKFYIQLFKSWGFTLVNEDTGVGTRSYTSYTDRPPKPKQKPQSECEKENQFLKNKIDRINRRHERALRARHEQLLEANRRILDLNEKNDVLEKKLRSRQLEIKSVCDLEKINEEILDTIKATMCKDLIEYIRAHYPDWGGKTKMIVVLAMWMKHTKIPTNNKTRFDYSKYSKKHMAVKEIFKNIADIEISLEELYKY